MVTRRLAQEGSLTSAAVDRSVAGGATASMHLWKRLDKVNRRKLEIDH